MITSTFTRPPISSQQRKTLMATPRLITLHAGPSRHLFQSSAPVALGTAFALRVRNIDSPFLMLPITAARCHCRRFIRPISSNLHTAADTRRPIVNFFLSFACRVHRRLQQARSTPSS